MSHLGCFGGKMVESWLRLVLALALVASARISLGDEPDTYRFRGGVELVSLSLTVTDGAERLVTDLSVDDFAVYEDGIAQEIEYFSREEIPLLMVLLLDTSASMREKMPIAQEAAIGFVQSLEPGDRAQVIEFNNSVVTLVDFTSDFDRVARAVQSSVPRGDTSLYDSVYVSLRNLSARPERGERQTIVLLSDGADTDSLVTFDDVRELARQTDALIYSICLFG